MKKNTITIPPCIITDYFDFEIEVDYSYDKEEFEIDKIYKISDGKEVNIYISKSNRKSIIDYIQNNHLDSISDGGCGYDLHIDNHQF